MLLRILSWLRVVPGQGLDETCEFGSLRHHGSTFGHLVCLLVLLPNSWLAAHDTRLSGCFDDHLLVFRLLLHQSLFLLYLLHCVLLHGLTDLSTLALLRLRGLTL